MSSYNRIRTVRLLTAQPSAREMALQGLRVLTGSPTQPFQRRLTRERVPIDGSETYITGDIGRIYGTIADLDFYGQEWENLQAPQDLRNQRGFNDVGVDFG